jgi:hypothetical protein
MATQADWDNATNLNNTILKIALKGKKRAENNRKYEHANCLLCNTAPVGQPLNSEDADIKHILLDCPKLKEISNRVCNDTIASDLNLLIAQITNKDPTTTEHTCAFWTLPRKINDPKHEHLRMAIAAGAVPNSYSAYISTKHNLSATQSAQVGHLFSSLMIERSLFIYKLHYKLHKEIQQTRFAAEDELEKQKIAEQRRQAQNVAASPSEEAEEERNQTRQGLKRAAYEDDAEDEEDDAIYPTKRASNGARGRATYEDGAEEEDDTQHRGTKRTIHDTEEDDDDEEPQDPPNARVYQPPQPD